MQNARAPTLASREPESGPLRSIGDVLRTLRTGEHALKDLYERVADEADIARNNGLAPSSPRHPHDPKWQHRVRCWLANQRSAGNAWPVDYAVWAIDPQGAEPCHFVLITR